MTTDQKPVRRPARPWVGVTVSALLGLALLGLSLGANLWKRDLPVKEVRAYGMKILSAGEVVALANIGRNEKLFDVDLNAVRRRVETSPYVRSASVTRDAPGRISITIRERVPVAALLAGGLLYVDESGFVLPPPKTDRMPDVPFLTGVLPAAECMPRRTVKAVATRDALALLSAARAVGDDLYHRISEVRITGGGLLCYTAESGVPVLFGQDDLPDKLVKFDSFWKEYVARQGAQNLQYVDLRFDDQVVARWNPRAELALHERTTP